MLHVRGISGPVTDGAGGPVVEFDLATPRAPNFLPGGNRPPVLTAIPNQTIPEQSLLSFTATATDPDAGQKLTFSLGADAPDGASIEAASGLFTWTPSEQLGPGN